MVSKHAFWSHYAGRATASELCTKKRLDSQVHTCTECEDIPLRDDIAGVRSSLHRESSSRAGVRAAERRDEQEDENSRHPIGGNLPL